MKSVPYQPFGARGLHTPRTANVERLNASNCPRENYCFRTPLLNDLSTRL